MDGTAKVIVLGMLGAVLAGCATPETLAPARAAPPPARPRASTRGIPQARPSTAVERVGRTLETQERAGPATAETPPAADAAPVVVASKVGALATALPPLLVGRWEGSLDFTISARLLVVDSVRMEAGAWHVQARFGVADADLDPVVVTLDLTDDRVDLRFVTTLASRVVLRLHADDSL